MENKTRERQDYDDQPALITVACGYHPDDIERLQETRRLGNKSSRESKKDLRQTAATF